MNTMPKDKPWWAPRGGLVYHILKHTGNWMQDGNGKWIFVQFNKPIPNTETSMTQFSSMLAKNMLAKNMAIEPIDPSIQNEKFVMALQKSRFASVLDQAEEGCSGRTLAFVLETIRAKLAREDTKNPYLLEIAAEVARLKSKGSGLLKEEDATIFMTNIAKWMTYNKATPK